MWMWVSQSDRAKENFQHHFVKLCVCYHKWGREKKWKYVQRIKQKHYDIGTINSIHHLKYDLVWKTAPKIVSSNNITSISSK